MKYKAITYREDVVAARERSKLTQQQIADRLGISRSSWQKYEYGKRTPESLELRIAILNLLGIPLNTWDGSRQRGRPARCKAS